jgi:hypothetical protein
MKIIVGFTDTFFKLAERIKLGLQDVAESLSAVSYLHADQNKYLPDYTWRTSNLTLGMSKYEYICLQHKRN